jgi:hypothetical protein
MDIKNNSTSVAEETQTIRQSLSALRYQDTNVKIRNTDLTGAADQSDASSSLAPTSLDSTSVYVLLLNPISRVLLMERS